MGGEEGGVIDLFLFGFHVYKNFFYLYRNGKKFICIETFFCTNHRNCKRLNSHPLFWLLEKSDKHLQYTIRKRLWASAVLNK